MDNLTRWAFDSNNNNDNNIQQFDNSIALTKTNHLQQNQNQQQHENIRRNSLKLVERSIGITTTNNPTPISVTTPIITTASIQKEIIQTSPPSKTAQNQLILIEPIDYYKHAAEMLAIENESLKKELNQLHTAATNANARRRSSLTGDSSITTPAGINKKESTVAQLTKTITNLEAKIKMLQHEVNEGKKKYDSLESRYKAVKSAGERKNSLKSNSAMVISSPPPPPPPPPPPIASPPPALPIPTNTNDNKPISIPPSSPAQPIITPTTTIPISQEEKINPTTTLAKTISEAVVPTIHGIDSLDPERIAQIVAKAIASELACNIHKKNVPPVTPSSPAATITTTTTIPPTLTEPTIPAPPKRIPPSISIDSANNNTRRFSDSSLLYSSNYYNKFTSPLSTTSATTAVTTAAPKSTSITKQPYLTESRVKLQNGILVVESDQIGQEPIPLEQWCSQV
jgi:hypothetical protein